MVKNQNPTLKDSEGGNILKGLNPKQQEAGKTRCLTHRVAWLIASGIDPDNILGLTFTNKAAAEMKSRIQLLLNPSTGSGQAGSGQVSSLDQARDKSGRLSAQPTIGTFHAIGLRTL